MRFVLSVGVLLAMLGLTPAASAAPDSCGPVPQSCPGQWRTAGQNIANTHAQPDETQISSANVSGLVPKWTVSTPATSTTSPSSDVSATPTIAGNTVFFPDWGGSLTAVNAHTGQLQWQHKISDYDNVAGTLSRTSPLVVGNSLILGDHPPNGTTGWGLTSKHGAHVFSVDAQSGALQWITEVDNTFVSQITGSAVEVNGVIYVGVSSDEEVTAAFVPNYQCCIFRGSVVALDANTGHILWKTYDMPAGYTGGAVWGSTPAVDPALGLVYVGTGNNYSVPPDVQACQDANPTSNTCTAPDDHFDSLMALDAKTGVVKWTKGTIDFDNWTVGCVLASKPNCPSPGSPDADFGSGPNLFAAGGKTLVGAGTKEGTYWALDAATGSVAWATKAGPGGTFGGIEFGSSVADGHVYVAVANSGHVPTTFSHPAPGSATSTNGGYWAALDTTTGAIKWQSADPAGPTFGATGQTATANGVVYAGSTDPQGHVFAMDANTGQIKWSFATGGSVASGPSIFNGTVYWGSGYSEFASSGTTGNNKVYAFSLPGGGN